MFGKFYKYSVSVRKNFSYNPYKLFTSIIWKTSHNHDDYLIKASAELDNNANKAIEEIQVVDLNWKR